MQRKLNRGDAYALNYILCRASILPKPTVVFIHGLWLHTDSWNRWIERFKAAGYDAIAPGWPGDSPTVAEARQHPERIAGKGIDDVVKHYADIIRTLDNNPSSSGIRSVA